LDRQGRKIIEDGKPKYNGNAISEAWDIPLLLCTCAKNQKPKDLIDFLRVNQFNIDEKLGNVPIILSTLVGTKTKELQEFLHKHSYNNRFIKKYALRIFVEEYIDAEE